MGDTAIHVDRLGKSYRIGQLQQYKALRDALADTLAAPVKAVFSLFGNGREKQEDESFWALRDVSFDVKYGEVVGVIGRNGAGKSTLLKILSRIAEPTEGYARIRGRVGSLLEVGTGFHPELTGRENVYLNGAIIGMRKYEIDRKFNEIVTFAEMDKFIDTPVKHYSSGMYVRLAFAVAAHLEPEILLVDEVLAVGDAGFQQKCLGKMGEVASYGRTVLFVSHNMTAIEHLCKRALLLDEGKLVQDGSAKDVIADYIAAVGVGPVSVAVKDIVGSSENGPVTLLAIDMAGELERGPGPVRCGYDARVTLTVRANESLRGMTFLVALKDRLGARVSVLNSATAGYEIDLSSGEHTIDCLIPRFPLAPGMYEVEVKVLHGSDHLVRIPSAARLVVEPGDFYGSGRLPDARWGGICHMQQHWRTDQ